MAISRSEIMQLALLGRMGALRLTHLQRSNLDYPVADFRFALFRWVCWDLVQLFRLADDLQLLLDQRKRGYKYLIMF